MTEWLDYKLVQNREYLRAKEGLDEMGSRNIFLEVNCRDHADAADVIAFIRDRSKPQ